MPLPTAYRHATKDWQAFLVDAREKLGNMSDNSAYTAVDGVLQVFRRRLTAQQGLDFAAVLPSVLRAIFVNNWKLAERPAPFSERLELLSEVKQVRVNHNLTPDNAIEATATTGREPLPFLSAKATFSLFAPPFAGLIDRASEKPGVQPS